MKRPRWGWSLLLIPLGVILGGLMLPPNDDFAAISKRGTLIGPDRVDAIMRPLRPFSLAALPERQSVKVRAWRLPDSANDVAIFLKERGYRESSMSTSESMTKPTKVFARSTDYIDFSLGSHAVVYEGTNVPKGSRCILEVREQSGISFAWRRFVGRLKRSFGG